MVRALHCPEDYPGPGVFLSQRERLAEPLGILAYPRGLLFCGLVSCIRGRRPRFKCGNGNLGTGLCVTHSSLELTALDEQFVNLFANYI